MNQPLKLTINERFYLRDTIPDDAAETFAMVDKNRAYLRQWMGWVDKVQSPDDVRQHIEARSTNPADSPEFVLVYDGSIIGRLGYHVIDHLNRQTSIGYWLDADHQGKGLMTMAVKALLDHAFGTLKLNRIVLQAAVDNQPSRGIAERIGFQQEGVARQSEWLYDHYNDLVVYAILKKEYQP